MFFDPAVRFEETLQKSCLKVADDIVEEIKRDPASGPNMTPPATVPKDTGRLMEGYEARPYENGAEVTNNTPYWKYVQDPEHRYAHSQPHVGAAVEVVKAERRLK